MEDNLNDVKQLSLKGARSLLPSKTAKQYLLGQLCTDPILVGGGYDLPT